MKKDTMPTLGMNTICTLCCDIFVARRSFTPMHPRVIYRSKKMMIGLTYGHIKLRCTESNAENEDCLALLSSGQYYCCR